MLSNGMQGRREVQMANIYELTGEFLKFSDIASSGELTEEQSEMLTEALENLKEDIEYKLEGYCKVRANFKADIEAIKAEKKRLDEKQKALENRVKAMEEAMKTAILAVKPDEPKFKTPLFTVYVQNNPESVVMDEQYIENVPAEYLRFAEPEIDRKKLLADLKAGKDLEGIAHIEQTKGLRIK